MSQEDLTFLVSPSQSLGKCILKSLDGNTLLDFPLKADLHLMTRGLKLSWSDGYYCVNVYVEPCPQK